MKPRRSLAQVLAERARGEVRRMLQASDAADRAVAKRVVKEALTDWWLTRECGDEPGDQLVDEIFGALTLAKIIKVASP